MRPIRIPSPTASMRDRTPPGGRRVASTRHAGTAYEDMVASVARTPHGARSARSHVLTPGTASSSISTTSAAAAAHDLAEVIQDVVGVRMQSLVDVRHRLDQLGDLYRREEAAFSAQMQRVLAQSDAVRATYETREEQLEAQVAKERAERTRILELMQQFKREGAHVIQVMRESLRAATHRWKTEVERNVRLTAILRKYGLLSATELAAVGGEEGRNTDGLRSLSSSSRVAVAVDTRAAAAAPGSRSQSAPGQTDGRIAALSQLVEEQDRIIVELQRRNREIERKLKTSSSLPPVPLVAFGTASGGGVAAAAAVPHDASLEDLAREYKALHMELKTVEQQLLQQQQQQQQQQQPLLMRSQQLLLTAKKCEVLERCVMLLQQRLAVEQRQRLRVEEQSSRMVSAQDQLVQTLEDRVRELESARSAAGGTGTPRRAATGGANNTTAATAATGGAPFVSPEVRPPPPAPSSWDADKNAADAPRLLSPPYHHQTLHDGYEPLPPPTSRHHAPDHRPSAASATIHDDNNRCALSLAARDGRSVASYESVHMVSLEEQLALVTKEFEESVQEWKTSQQTSPRQASFKSADTTLP